MMAKKEEAAVLAHNDPKALNPEDIVATFESAVNRNDLNAALAAVGLSTKEATILLSKYFPSLDKPVLSKCANPNKYGCVLHPHGYAVLRSLLNIPAPETQQDKKAQEDKPRRQRKKQDHLFTCRVAGRLPDDKYLLLQRYIRMEGYETTQDWVTAQVDSFIEKMEAKYGNT
jgi:hypothetical protein